MTDPPADFLSMALAIRRRGRDCGLRLALAAAFLLASRAALADGGAVQLREATGPFLVTVFTSPAALTEGVADVSVMVQQRDTGDVMLNAAVDLFLTPPTGVKFSRAEPFCCSNGTVRRTVSAGDASESNAIRATHERATNKLLYAAAAHFPAPGVWRMRLRVQNGGESGSVETGLPVVTARAGLVTAWPYLVMPFVLTALFAVHQKLKRRSRQSRD